MLTPQWTLEDDAKAGQLTECAMRLYPPDELWKVANVLITTAFGMLAERHGPQDALDTFVSIATEARRSFRN